MDAYITEVLDWAKAEIPESDAIISVTSPGFSAASSVNSGFVNLILADPDKRQRSQQEIADQLSAGLRQFTGARTFVTQEPTIGNRRGGLPVQFVIQAPNMDKLKEVLPQFIDEATSDPTFSVVDVNLKFNKPEIRVEINRERARALGVSVLDIAQTLQLAYAGQRFGYFIMDGKQYQVIGQMQRQYRNEPLDLRSLYVRNNIGEIVQLDNVVTLTEQSSPPQLFRFDRYVSATISAGLSPGMTQSDGIAAMSAVAANVLDDSFRTSLDGESRDFSESSSSLLFAFALALILIYLVLAAQFESFIDPLIILFTVPLAITGAFGSLWLFDQSLNIFSQIGIIMLIGLVTKNGILIVEFANQRKAQGLSVMDAIMDATAARFRPIMMTGLSTILGILPIALSLGAGSESRVSMGIAVIGGLIFAGILTLYLIPAIYSYFSRAYVPQVVDETSMADKRFESANI
jgi:multidrug efflux pump